MPRRAGWHGPPLRASIRRRSARRWHRPPRAAGGGVLVRAPRAWPMPARRMPGDRTRRLRGDRASHGPRERCIPLARQPWLEATGEHDAGEAACFCGEREVCGIRRGMLLQRRDDVNVRQYHHWRLHMFRSTCRFDPQGAGARAAGEHHLHGLRTSGVLSSRFRVDVHLDRIIHRDSCRFDVVPREVQRGLTIALGDPAVGNRERRRSVGANVAVTPRRSPYTDHTHGTPSTTVDQNGVAIALPFAFVITIATT